MLSDGYVKYEEAEVHRSAIMQDFRDNLKLGLYNCKICHGLSLCETLHSVLYSWSSYFAFFFSKLNITKLLKFKMATKRPF